MLQQVLFDILARMLAAQIVRSEREFCSSWLGMSPSYLADFRGKNRILADVSVRTTSTLRQRMVAVADFLPDPERSEIWNLVEMIDHSVTAANALRK